jgi:hypothetical protein
MYLIHRVHLPYLTLVTRQVQIPLSILLSQVVVAAAVVMLVAVVEPVVI